MGHLIKNKHTITPVVQDDMIALCNNISGFSFSLLSIYNSVCQSRSLSLTASFLSTSLTTL